MEEGLDALSQLRDIHVPGAVAFWPPAPGWWLLAAAVLAIVLIAVYRYRRRGINTHLRYDALAELARIQTEFQRHGDAAGMAAQLSILLRRIAVTCGGRMDVAGLSGEAWLRYLDETGHTRAFSHGPGQVLMTAPYQARADVDAQALMATASGWIHHVTSQRRARSPGSG